MPTKADQLKSILERLATQVTQSATKDEVMGVFKFLVKHVQDFKKSNEQEWSLIHSAFSMLEGKVKNELGGDTQIQELKKSLTEVYQQSLRDQQKELQSMYERIARLKDGKDGRHGRTPTRDELLTLIRPLIPQVRDGKDASQLDMEMITKEVIKRVPKDRKGRIGWGAHPLRVDDVNGVIDKVTREIKFLGLTVTRSPDGVVTVNAVISPVSTNALASADISSQANGSNKTFTIPTNTAVLSVLGSDAPFIYKATTDYTVSGMTLTFTGAVTAPSAGATVVIEYIPSGVSVGVSDLSLFTDGVTTSFTVPAFFSVIAVRCSDFPVIFRPTVDFTASGTTLTLLTPAPSAGSTLTFEYTISAAVAKVSDLSSQCNGSNLSFTIPAITSAVTLTCSDAPIIYRPGFDYVISGTTLTLIGVPAPSAGATLLFIYV